jgi:hypothetical protein
MGRRSQSFATIDNEIAGAYIHFACLDNYETISNGVGELEGNFQTLVAA